MQVEWHIPSEEEISFSLELLQEIVVPSLSTIEELLRQPAGTTPTPTWTNDFCRHLCIVRSALSGIPSLIWQPIPSVPGAVASDSGFVVSIMHSLAHANILPFIETRSQSSSTTSLTATLESSSPTLQTLDINSYPSFASVRATFYTRLYTR